ncbi:MAG TPA: DUF3857 domain-containing protein [Chitinophagaceae bacterium]|nr:DUF3857 domain-containing protein [Chitinophagaceae bacterium]
MKRLLRLSLLIVISILTTVTIFGQKGKNKDSKIPAFGSVDKADLQMKECDFDKNAEAMVLFEKGQTDFIIGKGIDFERHVRIKILNDKGKDRADVHLRYYNWKNDEEIKDISAQVYNLDASGNVVVTRLDKKQVFERQINKRWAEKVFTFPDVKPGSIIEYKYKHINADVVDWYFQNSIPVKYSEFTFDYPNEIEIMFSPKCYLPYEQKTENTSTRTVRFFSMQNIPALRDEPYILNEDDYLQKVESRPIAVFINGRRENITLTWPRVVRILMEDEDFGVQIKKEIPRTTDLDLALKNVSDPYTKMKIIHEYVKKNMEWNGNPGIWALNGVKAAWKDKKGTVGEINLILINLLKDAGLNAKPILVSTHDHGLINIANAGTGEFNKVLAWVAIGQNTYVLDATDKECPVNLIPPDVLATEGLVISKYETFEWGWENLWKDNLAYKNLVVLQGHIEKDGRLTGEATVSSSDYARLSRIAAARKGKKEFTEKYFSPNNPGITIDSIALENLDADSLPLVQKVYFNQQLSSSGDYQHFSVNLFTGLEKNLFVADQRISDVFFGMLQNHNLVGYIDIPEDYQFEELPKNIKMIMPDTSIIITRISQANENRLNMRVTLEFKKPFYTAGEYEGFREFYKKLFELLNEQFVIRKKANP